MLKEVLEDALERGEKLKRDIVGEVLKSAVFSDLVSSRRFIDAVTKIIHTKDEVGRFIRHNVQDVLKVMSIPSKQDLDSCEKRIHKLERELDHVGRRMMKRGKGSRKGRSR